MEICFPWCFFCFVLLFVRNTNLWASYLESFGAQTLFLKLLSSDPPKMAGFFHNYF